MNTYAKAVLSTMALLSTGCTSVGDIKEEGARINDGALNAAEFVICHGASVGSIRRHYGDPEKAAIWAALCNSQDEFSPVNR